MSSPAGDPTDETQPFLPRYEVLEPLGEGAVATVHKVRAVRDGAVRALKALKPEHNRAPASVRRFEDEFRILTRLRHPSLPEVFDYGITDEGTRYIVMDLVEGEPLDHYFRNHREDFWLLVHQLTEALAFVHEHELLHLDLKPRNVLVQRSRAFGDAEHPLVMLIDFGLSYARGAGNEVKLIGTPAYMPPEIIRGEGHPTRAADYYSLGVILYELIQEKLPFDGGPGAMLQAHLTEKPVLRGKKVEYAEMYHWVEALMNKDPVKRLESFQEFRRAVAERTAGAPQGLGRAYALGYIESLGLIGKVDLWQELVRWTSSLGRGPRAGERGTEARTVRRKKQRRIPPTEMESDLAAKIRDDLLAGLDEQEAGGVAADGSGERYVLLSGPPGSGKSFLTDMLRADLLPRGIAVLRFGEGSDYDALLSRRRRTTTRSPSIDPHSVLLDRFLDGWNRLIALAGDRGVAVLVDDLNGLEPEASEFLEYLIKRVELAASKGEAPRVFFVVTDENPRLKAYLTGVAATAPVLAFELPPPRKADVENLLETFHGHMSGTEERRALGDYLMQNLESDGAVMLSLRRAVSRGNLWFERGRWRFRHPGVEGAERRLTAAGYYRELLGGLPAGAAELVAWLSCHRGVLSAPQAGEVSGLGTDGVSDAREALRPYRVVEVSEEDGEDWIAIVSEEIRAAFYESLPAGRRATIHAHYIDYLSGYKKHSLAGYEALGFHYERAGQPENALRMRLKALDIARRGRNIFDIRRVCEEGIAYVRGVAQEGFEARRDAFEKFFIRNLIQSAWMTANYTAIVRDVDRYCTTAGRAIPLSFAYYFATALQRTGEPERCRAVIDEARRRLGGRKSITWNQLKLVEATLLWDRADYTGALAELSKIDEGILGTAVKSRYYVVMMVAYNSLGDLANFARYNNLAIGTASRFEHHSELLMAYHGKIHALLNRARHSEARREIRKSIRLAARHRAYRSLCTMYFMASAVYYEEGDYHRALAYLDKSLRLATDIGAHEQIIDYTVRYALIYQKLGRYGNAIHYLETVRGRLSRTVRLERYFFILLVLFDVHTAIRSRKAADYKRQVDDMAARIQAQNRLGFYRRLLGDDEYAGGNFGAALAEYEKAIEHFTPIDYDDDVVLTRIMMARSYVRRGEFDRAGEMLERARAGLDTVETSHIHTEYHMARLDYLVRSGCAEGETRRYIHVCEERRDHVTDTNIAMRMDRLLFDAFVYLQEYAKAVACFNSFYSRVKDLCGNLPDPDYVNDYISAPDFVELVGIFKDVKRKAQAT